jgi:5-methylcytosine-specific restriction endonuclease McrA
MHVDHLKPIFRGHPGVNPALRGTNTIDNLMPACKPCNLWKSTMTIEDFRHEIAAQTERLRLRSSNFRMVERYQLVSVIDVPVVFYFER